MDIISSRHRFRSREEYSRGLLVQFSSLPIERIERLFATVGETDPWGTVINPLWAVILEKVEEVWRSAKWTETRSIFENQNVERLFLERVDTQAPHDTLENMPFSLHSSLDPIPVSRDARLSGPERDQLTAPCWAHEEGPARRRTSVVKPPPDRMALNLESFLAQLAVPVKCAIRNFLSNMPSWFRSVWWPAFLRHAFPVLCCAPRSILPASPGVSSILLPPRHAVMNSLCGPLVGSSSPRGGTRVPFYLVGDAVGV